MEHSQGTFAGYGGLKLYYQCWKPESQPRAALLVVPGLAEHSGRYTNLVNHFVPRGYSVHGIDHRGHGRSEGRRGYVAWFEHYLSDLKTFFDIVRSSNPGTRIYMVGHSVGGTVATIFAARHQKDLAGVVLSGVTAKPGRSITPAMIALARLLSVLVPRMGVSRIDASAISRDPAVVDAYVSDPLVYCGKISACLGAELLGAIQSLPQHAAEIRLPILILQGTADRLSDPSGSEMLYRLVGSPDKTLKLYEGFYHEVFNEPGREQVFADMEKWLSARI